MSSEERRFEFARQVAGQIETISGGLGLAGVVYDPDEFSLTVAERDRILYLDNLFRETADLAEEERAARIARFVTALLASGTEEFGWEQVRNRLRPILRPVSYRLAAPDDVEFLARPAFPFLDELVAVDLPDRRSIVTAGEASEWGVPAERVFATARANLAALGPPDSVDPNTVVRFADDGNGYFTSRLLSPEWLAAFTFGDRRPVAFAPDVDTLIVAPDDPDVLEPLFAMAEQEYREATRALSPQGYTLDPDGNVVPFDLVGPHPQHAAARRAACGLAVSEYAAQSEWLRERFEEELHLERYDIEPAYVAGAYLTEGPHGTDTVTIWGRGVEYLLPRTDYIAFCDEDDQGEPYTLFTVPFPDALEALGLTPVPGLEPPRYEVRHWPDDATLTALSRTAVALE
ncbi:hypothetical protein NDR87_18295 [Nocardia sp. CDC159]|uniref:Uncharacterized protein n=1 Tax=Nocardia pulmonis TaxID=2951408 RepID=A0A9X2EA73_9NOCA|nr:MULTISPECIES: hypothetical protein [Nocardia]MCM6775710.1 hypothetical protein [Nocardia pulmonis]MCM6788314.1 hypothetical protein [Nocardia sp. CDC159]